MKRAWSLRILAMSIATLALASPHVQGQTEKGQVTIGSHQFDMKAGTLYSVRVEAKDFLPRVTMNPSFLPYVPQDFKKPRTFTSYYLPQKDEKNTIVIVPDSFDLKGKGPFDYEIEVKKVELAANALMDVKAELTANDPMFKADFASRPHHKSFDLKVKANEYYVIDMKEPERGKLDSYLYLLDSKGKVVRSDDDSGGFPSARIVFQAPADGEYRIIATGLGDALGAFQLTVRTSEKK